MPSNKIDVTTKITDQMVALVSNETLRPKRAELLWVDQGSIAKSSVQTKPRTRRLINSHVQRFTKNSQRPKEACNFDANIATFQRWRLEKPTESSSRFQSRTSSSFEISGTSPSQEDSQRQSSPRPPRSLDSSSLITLSGQLSFSGGITGDAVDPFHATTAKLDPLVLELFHYYIHVLVPSKWHVDSQSKQKLARIEAASKGVIQGCLSDELHLYSLLASMASRMQNLEHWPAPLPTDLYIHKALVALRRYMDAKPGRIETQVFHDMFFLCTAEAYRYNLEASMMHLRAIAQLVDAAGGLGQLENHMLLETLVQGDIMLAVEQLSTPVFPLTWDPGSFPHARWQTIKMITPLRHLGQSMLQDASLPPALRRMIHDVIQCVQIAQYVWTHRQSPKSDLEWIFLRYLAILHRLLMLECASWQAEAFRVALIMWLMIVMTKLGIRRSIKFIVPQLKLALLASQKEAEEHPWDNRPGLLLWILTTGCFPAADSKDEPWFLARLADVAGRLRIQTEAQLRNFLRCYFFLEPAQSASLSTLVAKLADAGLFPAGGGEPLPLHGIGYTNGVAS